MIERWRRGLRFFAPGLLLLAIGCGTQSLPSPLPALKYRVTDTFSFGAPPWYIAIDSSTHRVYVSDVADTLWVLDQATHKVLWSLAVGGGPRDLVIDAAGQKIYVAGGLGVWIIDGATLSLSGTIETGSIGSPDYRLVGWQPHELALDTARHVLYVTGTADPNGPPNPTVLAVDTITGRVTDSVAVGERTDWPGPLSVDSTTGNVYATTFDAVAPDKKSALSMIDGQTHVVTPVDTNGARSVAIDESAHRLYVVENLELVTIDARTRQRMATQPIETSPGRIAFDPEAHRLYICHSTNRVSVVDTTGQYAMTTVNVGRDPRVIAIDPATHVAWVANADGGTISLIAPGE
jgi:DNA-binding beta-propeller fold protein YncE